MIKRLPLILTFALAMGRCKAVVQAFVDHVGGLPRMYQANTSLPKLALREFSNASR